MFGRNLTFLIIEHLNYQNVKEDLVDRVWRLSLKVPITVFSPFRLADL